VAPRGSTTLNTRPCFNILKITLLNIFVSSGFLIRFSGYKMIKTKLSKLISPQNKRAVAIPAFSHYHSLLSQFTSKTGPSLKFTGIFPDFFLNKELSGSI
jgi:hypothetical protein